MFNFFAIASQLVSYPANGRELMSKQLRAVNIDGAMLTRMVDLHYSVPQGFISSQLRDNFHRALSKPSIRQSLRRGL